MNPEQERWRDEYELTGQNPGSWQLLARRHLSAANVLLERVQVVSQDEWSSEERIAPRLRMMPIYLLLGYALENLVKGLLVARGHNATWANPLEERKPITLDQEFKHHCLPELFQTASVKTSSEERKFLENLRDAIESEKYPVGVRPPSRKRTLGEDPNGDLQMAFELFRRVEASLRQICLDGVLRPCEPAKLGLSN